MQRAGRRATSAVGRNRSRGVDGRSRPTEIFLRHILLWPPLSLSLARSTRRGPRSRLVSRSTRPSPFPAPAPLGRRGATTLRIWPSLSPFSKACARPGSPRNEASLKLPAGADAMLVACRLAGLSALGAHYADDTAQAPIRRRRATGATPAIDRLRACAGPQTRYPSDVHWGRERQREQYRRQRPIIRR